MTNRDERVARWLPANAFAGGFLAVLVFAAVTWPVQEYAQQLGGAAAAPSQSPPINFVVWSVSSPKLSLKLPPSAPKFDFGTPAFNGSLASPGAGRVEGGSAAGKPWSAPVSFPNIAAASSEAGAASSGSSNKKHVGKGGLALGVVGVGVAALGVVFVVADRKTSCANQILSNVCTDVHAAGAVMIPTGAALAVTGFYLAFRHKQ